MRYRLLAPPIYLLDGVVKLYVLLSVWHMMARAHLKRS